MADRTTAARRRVSCPMRANAPADETFVLFCPVRERDWLPGWQAELVHTASGGAELDAVFRTPGPDGGAPETWVVSRYQPPSAIEFVRVDAQRVVRSGITLRAEGERSSDWEWWQVLTGLDEEGDAAVLAAAEAFPARVRLLERMLNHYLATGETLAL